MGDGCDRNGGRLNICVSGVSGVSGISGGGYVVKCSMGSNGVRLNICVSGNIDGGLSGIADS